MARIHASVQLDPDRAPEQEPVLRERVTVLREGAGEFWVEMEDTQVPTLLAAGMLVQPQPQGGLVELPALTFRPATQTPEPPTELSAAEPGPGADGCYLVHFQAPVDRGWLYEIAGIGGEFLQAIPAQAAVFRFSRGEAADVRGLPYVDFVGPWHPAYTVAMDLSGAAEPFSATSLRTLAVTLPPEDAPEGNLALRVFDGVNPESVRGALEAAGAEILETVAQGFRVRAPQARANEILRVPGIFSAEPVAVPRLLNHNAGVIVGTNQVRAMGTTNFLVNLDGSGEVGAVLDSGFDVGVLGGATPPAVLAPPLPPVVRPFTLFHRDLAASLRLIRNSTTPDNAALPVPDAAPHGTHVAGTIAGDGTESGRRFRGMAPGAALIGLGPITSNVRVPFDFAYANGARVINNSWGSDFNPSSINNNRYLPGEGQAVDRWCFDHPDVLVLFAASNDERDVLPAPGGDGTLDARSLSLQPTAKNALTVGASENLRNDGGWRDSWRTRYPARYNHALLTPLAGGAAGSFGYSDNADHVALFSDRGTVKTSTAADTGRVKPDVVAPGTNVISCLSQWVAPPPPLPGVISPAFYNANARSMLPPGVNRLLYSCISGTSMATPVVTGSALLIRQYYRTRFAQLRRPLLLHGVDVPAAAPFPTFDEAPSLAPHADGLVFAWVAPDLPANPRRIMAMRFSRRLGPVDAAPVQLQAAVGDHSAPRVARHGDRTLLLHRHADNTMRLSAYARALAPDAAFGAAGVVTLAPGARPDDLVAPDLLVVGDHAACVYPAAGGLGYFFQRFRTDTGAPVDPAGVNVMNINHAGPHASLVHTGPRYTVCGVARPANHRLQVRQVLLDGSLAGAAPVTLVNQPQEIREPCLLWDARAGRHLLVWCDARTQPGGEIYALFLDANAAAIGTPHLVMTAPPGSRMRRPRVLAHPETGYLLAWEDDTQGGHWDLYVALLDIAARVDARLAADAGDAAGRRLARVSDTPLDTDGFASLADAEGLALLYQSPDEINSDRLGVYALNLTPAAAFQAQADPNTPLLRSGRYVTATQLSHAALDLTALAAVWTGGAYYLLRQAVGAPPTNLLEWVRLNADGLVDDGYGAHGVRSVPMALMATGCALLWTGTQLVTAVSDALTGISIRLFDDQGAPVPGFGAGGAAVLADTVPIDRMIPPQVGRYVAPAPAPGPRVVVAYGTQQAGALRLRYQQLNAAGARVGAAVNLAQATGVARHGWFQFVNGVDRSIAVYHRVVGANTVVFCSRYRPNGALQGAEQTLSSVPGEALNGTLARRPTDVNANAREYGAVWQFRANNLARWELRFSRLDAAGAPLAAPPPLPPPPPPAPPLLPPPPMAVMDVPVIVAGTGGFPADRDAVEPQIISTYTHEPWANPPNPVPPGTALPVWSPAYGLAWIGAAADGTRLLYFAVLDENGRRIALAPPPLPPGMGVGLLPRAQVDVLQVSAAGSRVQDFQLVWNGRAFLLNWSEVEGGRLHHRCTMVNRHVNQRAYDIPSAALLRATLVNGATNIARLPLPDPGGYGWGRVNLRQALAPAPPVTLHVRDDCAIGPGRTASYRFTLPPGTVLLRVTLNWTDPPGPRLVNQLRLTVRPPVAPGAPVAPGQPPEYRGNLWSAVPGSTHLSRLVPMPAVAADAHEIVQTFKQVVVANPPPGDWDVEVSAPLFPGDAFNQQHLQSFALVFAGSGPEVRFSLPVADVNALPIY